ncbi:MAG TPA: SigE family RNA polymerase sigma factor [Micromonosporaceae bacterium]|nr:SigE family RNA polymerase sigma factor [Micromonosporaceae bacterium]
MLDSSFDEFVEGHIAALDRYAYALTGDRHSADDLVQETLVRVAGAWRRVRRDGNPTGYATTVMFRTYVSLWRKRRRGPQLVELAMDPASGSDSYAPVEARLVLRHALRTLPRLQQAVLVGTYLRDHNDDEIAEMIGRSPATVRSLRHRALKALNASLDDLTAKEVNGGASGVSVA